MATLNRRLMSHAAATALRTLIRGIDATLRRKKGIYDYDESPDCMFRVSVCRLADPFIADRVGIPEGGKMLELHFRSERVPPMPSAGPNLAYAKKLTRMATDSFRMLADYLLRDPDTADVVVIGGITNLFFSGNVQAGEKIFSRMGMKIAAHSMSEGAVGRFFTNLYAWMLMWTYNPQILNARKPLQIEWYAFWISKAELVRRYASETSNSKLPRTAN